MRLQEVSVYDFVALGVQWTIRLEREFSLDGSSAMTLLHNALVHIAAERFGRSIARESAPTIVEDFWAYLVSAKGAAFGVSVAEAQAAIDDIYSTFQRLYGAEAHEDAYEAAMFLAEERAYKEYEPADGPF